MTLEELIKKYFPQEEWQRALQVAMGESGGNPAAVGDQYPIRGQTIPSYGYFQIRGLPGRPSSEQLLNPEENVKYAASMQKEQGWSPWTVARKLGFAGATPAMAAEQPVFDPTNPQHKTQLKAWRDSEIAKNPNSRDQIMDYYNEFLTDAEKAKETKTYKKAYQEEGLPIEKIPQEYRGAALEGGVKTKDDENTIKAFESLRDKIGGDAWGVVNPTSPKSAYYRTQVNLLTQFLAKLIERNRLSDTDRKFYLEQTKPDLLDLFIKGRYKAKLDGVVDSLKARLGYSSVTIPSEEWEVVR